MPRNGKLVRITLALVAAAAPRSPGGHERRRGVGQAHQRQRQRRRQHVRRSARERVGQTRSSRRSGSTLNYNAIGSTGGVTAITNKEVDFGASDAPLSASSTRPARAASRFRGRSPATAVLYNLPGVPQPAQDDGSGPGEDLPRPDHEVERSGDQEAQPRVRTCRARRSPSSTARTGRARPSTSPTTSRTSAATWKSKVGIGTSVAWPTGIGGQGQLRRLRRRAARRPAGSAMPTSLLANWHTWPSSRCKNRSGQVRHPDG